MAAAATAPPLRWHEREDGANECCFATPIEWAAAQGFAEVVTELLKIDMSLIRDLASFKRFRRLERLWDRNSMSQAPKRRAHVVRQLIQSPLTSSLIIEGGYGPWALYCFASAGDLEMVRIILRCRPNFIQGDSDYNLSEILFTAAFSQNSAVFWEIVRCARGHYRGGNDPTTFLCGDVAEVPLEVMSKALHACASAGAVLILGQMIRLNNPAMLAVCRDATGGLALHSAAAAGHVDAVKELIRAAPETATVTDDNSNMAMHVAAYRGRTEVVDELTRRFPRLVTETNADGNSVLHLAVLGMRSCKFLDGPLAHIKLIAHLVSDFPSLVNCRNAEGRTALHLAVMARKPHRPSEGMVEILLGASCVDVNATDCHGMTAFDLAKVSVFSGTASPSLLRRLTLAANLSQVYDEDMDIPTLDSGDSSWSPSPSPGSDLDFDEHLMTVTPRPVTPPLPIRRWRSSESAFDEGRCSSLPPSAVSKSSKWRPPRPPLYCSNRATSPSF